MISYIKGTIILTNSTDGSISVFTNGIGYCVHIGQRTSQSLHVGNEIILFIETIVKETSITLYGFDAYAKQAWFNSLLKVSGVGPKVAMNALDSISIEDLTQSIVSEKPEMLQQVGGLGEKVSKRITSDLKKEPAKNAKILASVNTTYPPHTVTTNVETAIKDDKIEDQSTESNINQNDVISALINLGFDYNHSFTVAQEAIKRSETLEEAITIALRHIND